MILLSDFVELIFDTFVRNLMSKIIGFEFSSPNFFVINVYRSLQTTSLS